MTRNSKIHRESTRLNSHRQEESSVDNLYYCFTANTFVLRKPTHYFNLVAVLKFESLLVSSFQIINCTQCINKGRRFGGKLPTKKSRWLSDRKRETVGICTAKLSSEQKVPIAIFDMVPL